MKILGISALYHDSAACLVVDGEVVAAAQEERFTRRKHDASFPRFSVQHCLKEGGVRGGDLDLVAYYEKPFLRFERLLETHCRVAPRGWRQFSAAVPVWLREKLWVRETIRKTVGYEGRILFPEHHESHGASAFFPSPYGRAAVLTLDGVGEWATAAYGVGHGNRLELREEIHFPDSLGLLYAAFTYYTGFEVNSGEYKMMGLAPYGEPVYRDRILDEMVDLRSDGSFRLNPSFFGYCTGLRMTTERFHRLFGAPPRRPGEPIRRLDMDVAASIQAVTEEVVLRMAGHVRRRTGERRLCLAGGVALNCVANGRLVREGPFDEVWVQPAAGDAGAALGAALYAWFAYLGNPRKADGVSDRMKGALLGPEYGPEEIRGVLRSHGAVWTEPKGGVVDRVAELLAEGRIVGWFQGRMEFGPRALGARSILADPRRPDMQRRINAEIKFREGFRPFAPAVLVEAAPRFFELDRESPYMLLTAAVHPSRLRRLGPEEQRLEGLDRLRVVRSEIPAVTHVDNSARVQTVDRGRNPLFYELIRAFGARTGCPVLLNTSFNVRGEPIVESPEDALRCFLNTGMEYLAMGPCLLAKKDQPSGLVRKVGRQIGGEAHLRDLGEIRRFCLGLGLGLVLLAGWAAWRGATRPGGVLAVLGTGLGLLPFAAPRFASGLCRPIRRGLEWWGRTVVLAVLAVVYWALVTPMGVLLRVGERRGRSAQGTDTYWRRRPPPGDAACETGG